MTDQVRRSPLNWRLAILVLLFVAVWVVGETNLLFLTQWPDGWAILLVAVVIVLPLVHYLLAVQILRNVGLRWWWIACGVITLVAIEVWTSWWGLFWAFGYVTWITKGFGR